MKIMKRVLASALAVCISSAAALAQKPQQPSANAPVADTKAAAAEQDAKRSEIRKLIELTGAANVSADALRQILAPLRQGFPQVPDAFWDTFIKEVRSDELIDLVVPIYDKYYTRQEIGELTSFYQSPVGQKTIKVLPKLSAEAIDAGQEWGRMVADRAMRKLQQKGYDKTSTLFVTPDVYTTVEAREEALLPR